MKDVCEGALWCACALGGRGGMGGGLVSEAVMGMWVSTDCVCGCVEGGGWWLGACVCLYVFIKFCNNLIMYKLLIYAIVSIGVLCCL